MLTDTKPNGTSAPGHVAPEPVAARPAIPSDKVVPPVKPVQSDQADTPLGRIDAKLIENVGVTLEAFLGDARMTVGELTSLKEAAVVALDAALNQSVELRLNGVPVARGELVAVGDKFGVRLIEMAK